MSMAKTTMHPLDCFAFLKTIYEKKNPVKRVISFEFVDGCLSHQCLSGAGGEGARNHCQRKPEKQEEARSKEFRWFSSPLFTQPTTCLCLATAKAFCVYFTQTPQLCFNHSSNFRSNEIDDRAPQIGCKKIDCGGDIETRFIQKLASASRLIRGESSNAEKSQRFEFDLLERRISLSLRVLI